MIASDHKPLQRWSVIALWLLATVIGVFFALLVFDAAYLDGEYIPMGNDSFYHARRMLDTAVGARGFYQFDDRIHVPDGSWIPWPWAYDYLMGKAAALALWLQPATDPLGFLSHVPVFWLAVNAALFLAAAGQAGLALSYRAMAMLAFALAPFVQLMHMLGKIDHHFIEFTFVLLVTWLGLRLFAGGGRAWAIGLGLALGLAPGFHNGLFILQIPVLVSAGLLWLRGEKIAPGNLYALALALLAATVIIVLPSQPFQQGLFEFGLLSWFHLYAAASSAAVLSFIGWRRFERNSLLLLCGICLLLALPLVGQLTHGAAFLSQDLTILSGVLEAMSPYALFFLDEFGPMRTVAHYSWLLLLAPLLLAYYLWYASRRCPPRDLFFAVMTVFGLTFLLAQFRFNYIGLFSLIVGTLLVVQRLAERFRWHGGYVVVGLLAGILVAYQPPLRQHLFAVYATGAAPMYERARPLFLELAAQCAQEPGVVLASANDANYLLFHTECSVISNNFRLSLADERKIDQIEAMMRLAPDALRAQHPEVKYLLLRGGEASPLARALLPAAKSADGFELLGTIMLQQDGQAEVYAKAFALRHAGEQ